MTITQGKRYASRIGMELLIPIAVVLGGCVIFSVMSGAWGVMLIIGVVTLFIIQLFTNTWYEISGQEMRIKCGFLYDQRIDIKTIHTIRPSNNPISAPATSLNRLDIRYAEHQQVLISPKEKQAFLDHLLRIHPEIKVLKR